MNWQFLTFSHKNIWLKSTHTFHLPPQETIKLYSKNGGLDLQYEGHCKYMPLKTKTLLLKTKTKIQQIELLSLSLRSPFRGCVWALFFFLFTHTAPILKGRYSPFKEARPASLCLRWVSVHAGYLYVAGNSQIFFLSERQDLYSPYLMNARACTDWTSVYYSHPKELGEWSLHNC